MTAGSAWLFLAVICVSSLETCAAPSAKQEKTKRSLIPYARRDKENGPTMQHVGMFQKMFSRWNADRHPQPPQLRLELVDTAITNPCILPSSAINDRVSNSSGTEPTCFGDIYQHLLGSGELFIQEKQSTTTTTTSRRPYMGNAFTSTLLRNPLLDDTHFQQTEDEDNSIVFIRYYVNPKVDQILVYENDCQSPSTVLQVRSHNANYDALYPTSSWVDIQVTVPPNNDNDDDGSIKIYPYCVMLRSSMDQRTSYIMAQLQWTPFGN
eukprot:CAMPEP_0178904628 /NCGR_PEP_ID=MMETSP0786-20121207/5805_1 /TAXON_ID=186022 /ORGANISM="Thalassionema frauenfeldii, Strain CCMP 1798" /LENGTH=265 /DNA_ID=CAMNT_0020576105 /DNA_START=46 /DNA_END=844 /DNA_ORIENTATION=+